MFDTLFPSLLYTLDASDSTEFTFAMCIMCTMSCLCAFCSVLDAVMSSEAEFGSVLEGDGERSGASEQSSVLSLMAATWDYYGGKYVANVCPGGKGCIFVRFTVINMQISHCMVLSQTAHFQYD